MFIAVQWVPHGNDGGDESVVLQMLHRRLRISQHHLSTQPPKMYDWGIKRESAGCNNNVGYFIKMKSVWNYHFKTLKSKYLECGGGRHLDSTHGVSHNWFCLHSHKRWERRWGSRNRDINLGSWLSISWKSGQQSSSTWVVNLW